MTCSSLLDMEISFLQKNRGGGEVTIAIRSSESPLPRCQNPFAVVNDVNGAFSTIGRHDDTVIFPLRLFHKRHATYLCAFFLGNHLGDLHFETITQKEGTQ